MQNIWWSFYNFFWPSWKTFSYTLSLLKGQCHEIFNPWFFNQTIPPRALIHGLKPFQIWLRIRHENWDNCWKCMTSAVWYRPPLPRSGRDRWILKKNSTALFIHRKVVFCTKLLLKKFGFSGLIYVDCGSSFRGLIETAEAAFAVW
jgi:hypothetical protein